MLRPSSAKGLSYSDAVYLLGAGDSAIVGVLGRIVGVGVGAADAATLSAVDLFSLRDEAVRWGNQAVRGLNDRVSGVDRFDRTQRLVAAHTVLVVTSFFEAVDDELTRSGGDPTTLRVTAAEQLALAAGAGVPLTRRALVAALASDAVPMPSPAAPFDTFVGDLRNFYMELVRSFLSFVSELLAGERMLARVGRPTDREIEQAVVGAAVRRYEINYRSLATEVPEFAIWAAMTESAAGRAVTARIGAGLAESIAGLNTGLAGLHKLLTELRAGRVTAHRIDLNARHQAELSRPIVEVGSLPDGVRLPSARELYVNPHARVRQTAGGSRVATETWWHEATKVADVQLFFAGYLTGPAATAAPLVVLGQPGSGKSILSKALAANLPPAEFLAVRVELRAVDADAGVQDQIESGVYQAIGERVSWPELVRSANGALPVVLLDGFDELLQASGVNRADYLEQVSAFQDRESSLGRPLAVVVTSRTVVADRVRMPAGSTVLRIEPFDDRQIADWLAVWGAANASGLGDRGLRPLSATVAGHYGELAEQPLLLLMLALYDAQENSLETHGDAELDRADLYRRLFHDFGRREVGRRLPGATPSDQREAIDQEIHALALVAAAMFNRGTPTITDEQLDRDLAHLLTPYDQGRAPAYTGRPTAAHILVGRFFFVHESQARRDKGRVDKSFEFLHATFGEFLVADVVIRTLIEVAQRGTGRDAGELHAMLSFNVLTSSTPTVEFCRALLGRVADDVRQRCHSVLTELLRDTARRHPVWSLPDYRPVELTPSGRYAAFSANLVILLVLLSPGRVPVSGLLPRGPSRVSGWRSHALLWQSQLSLDGWSTLWRTLRVTNVSWDELSDNVLAVGSEPNIGLEDGSPVVVQDATPLYAVSIADYDELPESPFPHGYAVPADSTAGLWLREAAFRADGGMTAMLAHTLSPYWRHVAPTHRMVEDSYPAGTDMQALLELMFTPRPAGSDQRRLVAAYRACLTIYPDDVYQRAAGVQSKVMALLAKDAPAFGVDVTLRLLRAAIEADTEYALTVNLDGTVEVLVALLRATGDAAAVAGFCREFRDYLATVMNPDVPSGVFQFMVGRALVAHGLEIPPELGLN